MRTNKYFEKEFLEEILAYIESTYTQHYGSPGGIQLMDLFHSNGDSVTFCRDSAMKYIHRYGKKNGYDKKDLFKAIHYIAMLNYFGQDL